MLDEIPGIGEKRKKQLLKEFGSVKKMKEATLEEIIAIGIPQNVAEELIEKLKDQPDRENKMWQKFFKRTLPRTLS